VVAILPICARGEWVKVKEAKEVQVFEQKSDSSHLMVFRGEGLVRAPIARVASVIFDSERAKEWVDDLAETRIVKWYNETDYLEYDHMLAPIFVSDRDFLTRVNMQFDAEKSQLVFQMSNPEPADIPEELRKSKWVRGDLNGTKYTLTSVDDGKATFVVGEVHGDPKGALPIWLVNMFQRNWPIETLVHLRRQVAKNDVKDSPKMTELLRTKLKLPSQQIAE